MYILFTMENIPMELHTAFSVPSLQSFQLLVIDIYVSTLKMVSQRSSIDTNVCNPVVSPTFRLVTGTSVLATFIPSGIALVRSLQQCNVMIPAGSSFGSCSYHSGHSCCCGCVEAMQHHYILQFWVNKFNSLAVNRYLSGY